MPRLFGVGLAVVLLMRPLTAPTGERQQPAPTMVPEPPEASVVLPAPPAAAVPRDAERVAEEGAALERAERFFRAPGTPDIRRPFVDPDVVGAIQSRALERALRR